MPRLIWPPSALFDTQPLAAKNIDAARLALGGLVVGYDLATVGKK
jgi:hypothetical protein